MWLCVNVNFWGRFYICETPPANFTENPFLPLSSGLASYDTLPTASPGWVGVLQSALFSGPVSLAREHTLLINSYHMWAHAQPTCVATLFQLPSLLTHPCPLNSYDPSAPSHILSGTLPRYKGKQFLVPGPVTGNLMDAMIDKVTRLALPVSHKHTMRMPHHLFNVLANALMFAASACFQTTPPLSFK